MSSLELEQYFTTKHREYDSTIATLGERLVAVEQDNMDARSTLGDIEQKLSQADDRIEQLGGNAKQLADSVVELNAKLATKDQQAEEAAHELLTLNQQTEVWA